MKTAAVIAEWNPLHNGHAYFLETVRERSCADYIIAVMSGDFVQRGEPAVFDKYIRTLTALACGADLVLELPVRYAAANAGDFAAGAVSILHGLGTVDELWFGSESGNSESFLQAADILAAETDDFKKELSAGLKQGLCYPQARADAILKTTDIPVFSALEDARQFLESPNNILGLEYCIALKRLHSNIVPMTLQRKGNGYHSDDFSGRFPSASAIRTNISGHGPVWEELLNQRPSPSVSRSSENTSALSSDRNSPFPAPAAGLLQSYCSKYEPVFADDFSLLLKYRLMTAGEEELSSFAGVSEDLAHRIMNSLNEFDTFSGFAERLKTRSLTRTHVNRALLHILLGIRSTPSLLSNIKDRTEEAAESLRHSEKSISRDETLTIRDVHVLGMKNAGALLSAIKEKGSMNLCSSFLQFKNDSCEDDLFASNLYETVKSMKSGTPFVHELERRLIVDPDTHL